MLKQRIITAAILIPLLIAGVIGLSSEHFAIASALVILLGSWEWAGLMRIKHAVVKLVYVAVILLLQILFWKWQSQSETAVYFIMGLACLWWLIAVALVIFYPRYSDLWAPVWIKACIGISVLLPAWYALYYFHSQAVYGPAFVLYLFAIIVMADSGAYFGGRRWGKHKLAPQVSPGKTREGVFSGMICAVLVSLIAVLLLDMGNAANIAIFPFVLITMITVIFSVLGDLAESLFKRQAGVKDSGRLLPGHGGVLDRVDSVTAAAPIFMTLLWLLTALGK